MSSYNNVNFLIPALKKVFLSDVSFSDFLAKDKKAEIEKNIINEQNLQVNFKNNIFIRDLNYYHFNDQRPFFNKLNLKITNWTQSWTHNATHRTESNLILSRFPCKKAK